MKTQDCSVLHVENGGGGREGEIYTSVTLGSRKAGAQLGVMSKEIACTFNDDT